MASMNKEATLSLTSELRRYGRRDMTPSYHDHSYAVFPSGAMSSVLSADAALANG
jgi:hypothetical protein